jgi:glycosyltransferase involved in cell wall biosynthesis
VVTSRQLYENPRASLPPLEHVDGVEIQRMTTATRGRSNLLGRALDYSSFHVAAALHLLKSIRRGDVVVAKTDPPLISIVVSVVARLRGAVLVNWLQDLFPEVASVLTPGILPAWAIRLLTAARNSTLRHAAMNVVLSERMRRRVSDAGVSDSRIRIIPNWADTASIVPCDTRASHTRTRHNLGNRFVIGYSGNLGRAHEFETLVGAARLLRNDPHFAFLITGSGAKADALRDSIRAEGIDSFYFQRFQPAELLSDSLAAADVHFASLLPGLEGLIVPSKVYGIMAAGRPAVFVGDTSGDVATVLQTEGCGIAVEVGDSTRLAAELTALRDSPERLRMMGRRARELALARYTSAHAVAVWAEFLNELAPDTAVRRKAVA